MHSGHPWVFSNEIIRPVPGVEPGGVVSIFHKQKFVGNGFYNPRSLIAIRIYSDNDVEFDRNYISGALKQADQQRRMLNEKSYRMVNGESDGLPGLIVDRYGSTYVIQIHALGIDARKSLLIDALSDFLPNAVYEKSDSTFRELEGLPSDNGPIVGEISEPVTIEENGIKFLVDIIEGQKTGFFFDLRDIRRRFAEHSAGRRVLDLFCYTGSFACYARKAGAASVLAVDSSKKAIELAAGNRDLNGLDNIEFKCSDVHDFFYGDKEKYDLIILDPPSFTRTKKNIRQAKKGYWAINRQAVKRLSDHGVLFTTCCSYHFNEEEFEKTVAQAAADARCRFRIIDRLAQASDHPILLGMPESRYLKCLVLQRQ
jgi:23S rRNA (cytosine1962-C5)-methyltransferase